MTTEDKGNNEKKKVVDIKVTDDAKVVERSTIKRMMDTLDRFLSKRFLSVIAFCTAIIAVCAIGLSFTNITIGHASSADAMKGNGGNLTLDIWLWSAIAVFGFIAIVTCVYYFGRKKAIHSIK